MDYIEEKTPNGITIKVLFKNWEYTAFNRDGSVIYADDKSGNILRKVTVVAFYGKFLSPVTSSETELLFYKNIKNEIVVPYDDIVRRKRKYLFLKNDEILDMVPVRIVKLPSIYKLVREIESGIIFNYIIIDKSVSRNEIVIIKNRCQTATILQTGLSENSDSVSKDLQNFEESQAETESEKNLNMLSNNPVFLAKIHLKNLALSKVNQILLDFDISSLEAEYMLRFIETMLNNKTADEAIEKNRIKLEAQADAFRFYIYLINKNDMEIRQMIEDINDQAKISLYSTLVAKVKILFSKQEELLLLTEYENLLFEAKDRIQNK